MVEGVSKVYGGSKSHLLNGTLPLLFNNFPVTELVEEPTTSKLKNKNLLYSGRVNTLPTPVGTIPQHTVFVLPSNHLSPGPRPGTPDLGSVSTSTLENSIFYCEERDSDIFFLSLMDLNLYVNFTSSPYSLFEGDLSRPEKL